MSQKNFPKILPQRNRDSNKGNFGHVLIIGSDYGMAGATILAAEVAYRSGAGKVTVLTRKENFTALISRLPNAMTAISENLNEEILENKNVIVIGCGLGKSAWARDLFEKTMETNLPKVIDADALNILSEATKKYNLENCIITPHVGEAARLLNISPDEIQKNRETSVKKLYEKFGAASVLKGNKTLVFGNKKILHRCEYGNPGMATAGIGDILSGIIGALVAQHLEIEEAAIRGCDLHAFAGDLVAKEQGEIGMMPQDLFKYLPKIINGNF